MSPLRALVLIAFCLSMACVRAVAAGQVPATAANRAPSSIPDAPPNRAKDESAPLYRYRLSSAVGALIVQANTALQFGSRLGFAPGSSPLFFGAEFNYAIYSPGSVFGILGGGWYEMRVYGAPRLSVSLGVMGGMAMVRSSPLTSLAPTVPAAFFEAAVAQQVDDLVSIQGQVRPGIVGGYFAIMMSFGVCFRFL